MHPNTSTHCRKLLASIFCFLFSALLAHAQPPDLTKDGAIAGIKKSSNFNLGSTGLRGWIWMDKKQNGFGQASDLSRQILVTEASPPGNSVIQVDDIILGAIAADSGAVPAFTSDCRKAFATAITDAEKTGAGTLRVKRWRAGATADVNIPIAILGDYSATAPFNCPKSATILANARNQLVSEMLADPDYFGGGYHHAIAGLALLSAVIPGDPDYDAVQARLQAYARLIPSTGNSRNWMTAYKLVFLAEYYLITGDAEVVAGINQYTLDLARAQSFLGTYGHRPSTLRQDGSGRMICTAYGAVNSCGAVASMALVLGKKALQAANLPVDPEIDTAITRSANFLASYTNKGSIPYGEMEPEVNNHTSNGKNQSTAVFLSLLPDRATETEYFTRLSISGWKGREQGHSGQGFSYLWGALGANVGGDHATSEFFKTILWSLDLTRRTNGSFTYDSSSENGGGGRGRTEDGTYLGRSHHHGTDPTAIYLLTYSIPYKRLYITGKKDVDSPDHRLSPPKVAHAISAASFPLMRSEMDVPTLFVALGDFDVNVRHHASVELSTRTLTDTQLNDLRALLDSPEPNFRESACKTLGLLQDSESLPALVARLNDPEPWVRAIAARAIRQYPVETISPHRDAMLTAYNKNAPDPHVVDWADPIQDANSNLSSVLFGTIASATAEADRQTLFYPALQSALKLPESRALNVVAQFANRQLSVEDAQVLHPEILDVASHQTLAHQGHSFRGRSEAMSLMGKLRIKEGIPLALSLIEEPLDFKGDNYFIAAVNALAAYGDEARYTLPILRKHLSASDPKSKEYPALVKTIKAIENAVSAPPKASGLSIANSQVVTTTGPVAIKLTGSSPRPPGNVTYLNVTEPAHGTLTGTAPDLTYTPAAGYSGPDSFTFQTSDTTTTSETATVSIIVGPSGDGLKGEYFVNANFTDPKHTRIDPQIDFDWGKDSPHPTIDASTFSVVWSGTLLVPETTVYTFSALTSDGIRLYINGQRVLDNFTDQDARWTDSTPIRLKAGQYADIHAEYHKNTGSAVAKLKWTGPSIAGPNGDFIPTAYLFNGMSARPLLAFAQNNLTTDKNTALPITLHGSGGGTLRYQIVSHPTNGRLTATPPNLITYNPAGNFSGNDSFTFLVSDGTTNSPPATIAITVQDAALTEFNWAAKGNGKWSDPAHWSPAAPATTGQTHYALNFTSSGTATHDLNDGFRLNRLNFTSMATLDGTKGINLTANGGSLPQIHQNTGVAVNISNPLTLQDNLHFDGDSGGKITLTGIISGNGGIVKNNFNVLEIRQTSNTYSGDTTVNAGTLSLNNNNRSNDPDYPVGTGTITVNPGATLRLGLNKLTNNIILNNASITGGSLWGTELRGDITLEGINRIDLNGAAIRFTGDLSGPGGITFSDPHSRKGEHSFRGTATYTGPTTIESNVFTFHTNAVPPGPLLIHRGGVVELSYTGTQTIESLTLGGETMPPGIYGASTHSAYFTGKGSVTVSGAIRN